MPRRKKQSESESSVGAPEWMVTFSDCMTLLLTFFVLLLSFSSFDERIFLRFRAIFEKRFSLGQPISAQDALLVREGIEKDDSIDKGSEKPTLEKGSKDQLKEETEPRDFHNKKIFLISSDQIFYGSGTIISLQGRKVLSTMASFLTEVPARVVISENCQDNVTNSGHLGLERAWAVIEYITARHKLDKQRFSISAGGTVAKTYAEEDTTNPEQYPVKNQVKRTLEIVLLERSIYN